MEATKKILTYLSIYGKENKHRLASALNLSGIEVTEALIELEKEGKVEMKGGKAFLVKGKKPITKVGKPKKEPKIEEEQPVEEKIEQPQEEIKPEILLKEEPEETEEQPEEVSEKPIEEERIEGTVKFFNVNKGFGFIK